MTVGKIHLGVVRAPAYSVGNPDIVVDSVQVSALQSIEGTARALHRFTHGADPKPPPPVATTVIEDVDCTAGLRINDAIELSACRIVVGKATPPCNQQSLAHTRRKRAELFWRRPAFECCALGIETMNSRFECVDPIEHPLDRMPARNLAEDVLSVRDTHNFDHDDLCPDRSHTPRVKNSPRRFFCNLPVAVSGSSASLTNFIMRGIL